LIGSNILYAIVNGDAIYRMDKDGNIDYTLQVGGNLLSSSSIANDSTVYIGSTDNNIYAFSKNGTSLWVRPLGGAVTTTPTIDILNDRVYVGVSNRNFQFLNRSNGNVLGNYFSDSPINTSAVITTDNRLFFSTVKGTMYGFDLASISFPNVIPTWTITSSDTISSSPAIDAEGFFYVGTKNGLLKKISMQPGLQGTVVWQANLGGSITASPVIDASGNIYVGSSNNNFYVVDRMNGDIKWSYPFGGQIKTTAAISDNANIYFGTSNGYIYCIDTLGTTLWQYEDSSSICSSLLYSDGVLYLGTLDGRLVALYDQVVTESSTLLANNIWGTFQGNNQRTGEQADRLTSIKEKDYSSTPTEYTVFDNFPNPFNPSTIIRYALPFQSKVKIEVYNIIGELVKDLADLEQAPGFYDITFDASGLSSGIYIYRIVAQSMDSKNKFSQVKKMILLK
jgi:outer membrane protein assembly factor BamB